jgi:acyl-[acyl-carrier-protein]-phospholipid O-acyltransferase / long-chain-fatty-acid--[acyl-carrier-protein] ligase
MPAASGPLLRSRHFAPLFWCQFLSALNDNILKTGLAVLALWQASPAQAPALVTLAGAALVLPFLLLSGTAGALADRHDKAWLARRLKLAEFVLSGLAAAGFLLGNLPLLFAALLGFGTVAALFGPIKYALLPDHLPRDRLVAANALVEFATFLAIIAGTVCGGLAQASPGWRAALPAGIPLLAGLAWLAARRIPDARPADPRAGPAHPWHAAVALIRILRADRRLWHTALLNAWFWLAGSVAMALVPPLVKDRLGGDAATVSLALGLFSLGIGPGAALAVLPGHWRRACRSRARHPLGLGRASFGAAMLAAACTALAVAMPGHVPPPAHDLPPSAVLAGRSGLPVAVLLVGMAAGGGLLAVRAFAALQGWAPPAMRSRAVAGANLLSAAAMVAGALVLAAAQKAGLPPQPAFGALGALAWIVVLWMTFVMPRLDALPGGPISDAH